MCIDLAGISSVAVSAVALIVAALALSQGRSLAQNPIVFASFNPEHGARPYGTSGRGSGIAYGPKDYSIDFKLLGPGAVYDPTVTVDDTRVDDGDIKWTYLRKDDILTAGSGIVEIFLEGRVSKHGLYVILSFDRPRRFRRGASAVHYRYAIPRHTHRDDVNKTEKFKRGKWRRIKMKEIKGPSVENPVKEDRKLRNA